MANRSMTAKVKRAVTQRQEAGAREGNKPAYHTNKPLLREIAASVQLVPKYGNVVKKTEAPTMVLYNPSIYRAPKALAIRCMVTDCGPELVRRKDYFRR